MSKIQSPAKIACIQMRISYCRVEENLAEADRLIEAACENGATLLIRSRSNPRRKDFAVSFEKSTRAWCLYHRFLC